MILLQLPYDRPGKQIAMHTPASTCTTTFDTTRSVPRNMFLVFVCGMSVLCKCLHSVVHKTTGRANIGINLTRRLRRPRRGHILSVFYMNGILY